MKHHKHANILIFGPQGSGKGTQAEILSQKLGIPAISAGAVLRRVAEENSNRGKQVKSYLNKGKLVPGELTNEMMAQRILEKDCENGFIWDGFPRNKIQANFIIEQNIRIDAIVALKLPDEAGVSRISGRRTCANGHSYHTVFAPPKTPNICDRDGLPLIVREDETEDAVRLRLRIYHTETEPQIELFRERGVKILEIDGRPAIEEVARTIEKKLNLA